ncbi:MAG TPA: hypothetical protein VL069_04490 [Opitutus sp.]|nr:hypothetical protein [Opitutus sp.]
MRVYDQSTPISPLLKSCLLLLAVCFLTAGCSTPGSYLRVPARFTALPPAANTESYLIELVYPRADPQATRYEFTFEDRVVTAHLATISATGARSERRRSGEVASRLLQLFRGFDWSSIEAPPPDDDGSETALTDAEIVFKARTARSYREVQVRLADCPPLEKLLADLESIK